MAEIGTKPHDGPDAVMLRCECERPDIEMTVPPGASRKDIRRMIRAMGRCDECGHPYFQPRIG